MKPSASAKQPKGQVNHLTMYDIDFTQSVILYLPYQRPEANPKQQSHHHEQCTTVYSSGFVISALPTKKARKVFWFTPLQNKHRS
jgi:hypothetical protein